MYRTYDVDDVISVPLTIDRVSRMLALKAEDGVKGLVNCEDEVYVAAGLGCTMGIMRHSVFAQDLAGEKAVDISKAVTVSENGIVIPGELLNRIGTMAATPGDISSPGTVIRIYDAAERWTEEQAIEEVETIKRLNERKPRP